MLFLCPKGGDSIYLMFGDSFSIEDYNEEVEDVFIDWILTAFARYKEHPPKVGICLDDVARYITKEFNVRKYIFENGRDKSIENIEKILDMDIDKRQKEKILEKIGEQTLENESWVSEVRIFEILNDYEDIAPSSQVTVMHPEINEKMEKSR